MKITVKILSDTTKVFEVEPSDKIFELRLIICEWLSVTYHGNALRLHADPMDNEHTFETYEIIFDRTILITLGAYAIPLHDKNMFDQRTQLNFLLIEKIKRNMRNLTLLLLIAHRK